MKNEAMNMFTTTVKYSGDAIFIKPFCDYFQIEYDNQCRRIKSSQLLQTSAGKNPSMLLFGDERERITLTKQGFITWILQLRCQIVHPSLKEKLIQYQSMIFDFMFGNIDREEKIKTAYAKLKKYRTHYAKVGRAIQLLEKDVNNYLEGKFSQGSIGYTYSTPKALLS